MGQNKTNNSTGYKQSEGRVLSHFKVEKGEPGLQAAVPAMCSMQ